MNVLPATIASALVALVLVVGCRREGPSADVSRPPDTPVPGAASAAAKRIPPPEVPPVTIGDLRIEAVHWGKERGLGQNGGYIAAFDASSGDELWTLQLYAIDYDAHLEEDVQDIFIENMERSSTGDELQVTDERGRRYLVDVPARTVRRP